MLPGPKGRGMDIVGDLSAVETGPDVRAFVTGAPDLSAEA